VAIVEDDLSVGRALDRLLRLSGFEPFLYASAEDLLADANSHGATCLVLDVQLPGLSGFELYERFTQMHPGPPVIFITAFDEPEARAKAARAGAVAFLVKPFTGRHLLDTLKLALDEAGDDTQGATAKE
jgi:FixJ family two-component response regulator